MNPGLLAPQAKNINHLQTAITENKRLATIRFERQLDAPRSPDWRPACFARAVVAAVRRPLEETSPDFLYRGAHRCTTDFHGCGGFSSPPQETGKLHCVVSSVVRFPTEAEFKPPPMTLCTTRGTACGWLTYDREAQPPPSPRASATGALGACVGRACSPNTITGPRAHQFARISCTNFLNQACVIAGSLTNKEANCCLRPFVLPSSKISYASRKAFKCECE